MTKRTIFTLNKIPKLFGLEFGDPEFGVTLNSIHSFLSFFNMFDWILEILIFKRYYKYLQTYDKTSSKQGLIRG